MTFLKPLSAAIAIGTGGPFGAEGPIIATGGALGSLARPVAARSPPTSARRCSPPAPPRAWRRRSAARSRRCCSPIELLLFEYRPRSLIPVALAARRRPAVRIAFVGAAAGVRHARSARSPAARRWRCYIAHRRARRRRVGRASRARSTRIEDGFEQLPIHWMWWPALGAIAVGVVGYFAPRTLGVGYDNIEQISRRRARRPARWRSCACSSSSRGRSRSAAAPRAARWRRCSRSAAASGALLGLAATRVAAAARRRSAHRGAGRHGGDVRRRLARAAGVGGVRVRDHAPAARPAAAARRLRARRSWSRACSCATRS